MAIIDLEGADACCVINSCVLETPDGFTIIPFEFKEFYINLYLMARYALLVALSMDFSNACTAWKPTEAIASKNAVDASIGDGDAVISAHVPGNSHWSEMVFRAQMQNFLDDFCRLLIGWIFRCT